MKLLLDENVSNKIKEGLIELGQNYIKHINDINKGITDEEVFETARKEERIIITGDADFKGNKFKFKIPIIWITPRARTMQNIAILIVWILDNIERYNVNLKKAFITLRTDRYIIEHKTKKGVFGKTKTKEISFEKIKKISLNKIEEKQI